MKDFKYALMKSFGKVISIFGVSKKIDYKVVSPSRYDSWQ